MPEPNTNILDAFRALAQARDQRTQDVATKTLPTRRETLLNMLKDIRLEPTARGMGVEGRVGPVEYRVMKNLKQPLTAGARVRLGPTEWNVDRESVGVEGRVGPVEYRVMKNLKQPLTAGARVRLGPTEWNVDRESDGTFAAKVNVTLPLGKRR